MVGFGLMHSNDPIALGGKVLTYTFDKTKSSRTNDTCVYTIFRTLTHLRQYQQCHFFAFQHCHHLHGARKGRKCVQYRARAMDVEAWQN